MEKFKNKIWLSSPTMHGDELKYMKEAYEKNWMSTVGENINEVEKLICKKVGCQYAVALSSGTSTLHLAVKLAGIKPGDKVFCSDMTFSATVNPVTYEGGVPVFIDSEYETWNMDPKALEKAFGIYPEVKVVVLVHLYGTPGKIDEIKSICDEHNAIIIEDAAESLGATYKGIQTGTFGMYNAISFNGNKIITGSSGGMFLTDNKEAADKARKWSTQSRENAPWYQHEEIGYNYRMSNVIAGVVRGQIPYLEEHIAQKKAIYERYKEGLKGLPITMNPFDAESSENLTQRPVIMMWFCRPKTLFQRAKLLRTMEKAPCGSMTYCIHLAFSSNRAAYGFFTINMRIRVTPDQERIRIAETMGCSIANSIHIGRRKAGCLSMNC